MAEAVKNLPAMQETQVQSLGWEDPLEKKMATHSNIFAGKLHGQRSLVGYSPVQFSSVQSLSHVRLFATP